MNSESEHNSTPRVAICNTDLASGPKNNALMHQRRSAIVTPGPHSMVHEIKEAAVGDIILPYASETKGGNGIIVYGVAQAPYAVRMDPSLGEYWEVPLGDTWSRLQQKFPYWELEGIMGKGLKGFIRWSFFWLTDIDPVAAHKVADLARRRTIRQGVLA